MDFLNRVVKFRKGSSGVDGATPSSNTTSATGKAGVVEESTYEEVDLGTGGTTTTTGPTNYGAHASSPVIEMQTKSIGSANGETVAAQGQCEGEFTVEQAVEAIGFGRFQIQISALTGLAWMADATEMMLLSILSPELRCIWNLERWQEALITTVVFIGMFISSTIWGKICDKYGRRKGLIMCSVWLCYYGFLSSFSTNFIWILLLRGLVGFGIGGVPQSITLYAEFLPSKARGMCVVFIEVFWAIGTVMEVLLALVVMPTLGWHYLLFFSAIPVLIFIFCCKWLPESARYHVACGNQEKAHAILKQVALCNNKPMPLGKLKIEENIGERGTYRDLFKTKELAITSILLLFIWFANAFCYYGLVLLSTELFASGTACADEEMVDSGLECESACKSLDRADYISLLWTTLAEFPGVLITFLTIELLGRKKTMAVEFLGFSFFTFLLFVCSTRTVLTIFLFASRALISGAFQAAYVYTPEVYPTATRALGMGCCSAMARVGAIITPFVAQVLLGYTPALAISIYGTVASLAAIACMLLPVETKGREMVTAVTKASHLKS